MRRLRLRQNDDSGQAVLGLIATIVVVLIAAGLLQRAAMTASSINDKAKTIALTGRGINESTDSIMQLNRTNELAVSILSSAKPLEGKVSQIVELARTINGQATSINGSAKSINGSAVSINSTAGGIGGSAGAINDVAKRINGLAGGINGEAAGILATARSIDRGVAQININLDSTIAIANQIRSDTSNLVSQAVRAEDKAACIARRTSLLSAPAGNCD